MEAILPRRCKPRDDTNNKQRYKRMDAMHCDIWLVMILLINVPLQMQNAAMQPRCNVSKEAAGNPVK